jgi:hypothetical protein
VTSDGFGYRLLRSGLERQDAEKDAHCAGAEGGQAGCLEGKRKTPAGTRGEI